MGRKRRPPHPYDERAASICGQKEKNPIPEQIPTVGRTVRYVLNDTDLEGGKNAGEERAAVITRVWPGVTEHVQLTVFLDGANEDVKGLPFLVKSSCTGSSGPVPCCWHWPERT